MSGQKLRRTACCAIGFWLGVGTCAQGQMLLFAVEKLADRTHEAVMNVLDERGVVLLPEPRVIDIGGDAAADVRALLAQHFVQALSVRGGVVYKNELWWIEKRAMYAREIERIKTVPSRVEAREMFERLRNRILEEGGASPPDAIVLASAREDSGTYVLEVEVLGPSMATTHVEPVRLRARMVDAEGFRTMVFLRRQWRDEEHLDFVPGEGGDLLRLPSKFDVDGSAVSVDILNDRWALGIGLVRGKSDDLRGAGIDYDDEDFSVDLELLAFRHRGFSAALVADGRRMEHRYSLTGFGQFGPELRLQTTFLRVGLGLRYGSILNGVSVSYRAEDGGSDDISAGVGTEAEVFEASGAVFELRGRVTTTNWELTGRLVTVNREVAYSEEYVGQRVEATVKGNGGRVEITRRFGDFGVSVSAAAENTEYEENLGSRLLDVTSIDATQLGAAMSWRF